MISHIKLYNFRSYELFEASIDDGRTIIIGSNGAGKTSLLEAAYVLLRGSGFRGSLSDLMRRDANQTVVQLEMSDGTSRRLQLLSDGRSLSKEFTVNQHKSKLLPAKHRLPIVLFEPNDLRLITSSPGRRRDFLDGLLSRVDNRYASTIRSFERTLLQRNELLKRHQEDAASWRDHLFAWDVNFVQSAATVAKARANFLYENEARLSQLYSQLAGTETPFAIDYLPSVTFDNYEQALINHLQKSRDLEVATGHTSAGPQREDFAISLHNQLANKVASRGETRTIMLAFKLLELELQAARSDVRPLILLDDVFSELDASREQQLISELDSYQTIITATDLRDTLKDRSTILSL